MEKEGEIAFIFLIKGNLDKPSLKCTFVQEFEG